MRGSFSALHLKTQFALSENVGSSAATPNRGRPIQREKEINLTPPLKKWKLETVRNWLTAELNIQLKVIHK